MPWIVAICRGVTNTLGRGMSGGGLCNTEYEMWLLDRF